MIQLLMDNSITLIFLIAMSVVLYSESKKYMERKNMTGSEFRSFLRTKVNEVGNRILSKGISAAAVAFVISIVSFRELWVPDVFHVVFVTSLLLDKVESKLSEIFE